MATYRGQFKVSTMCRVLEVSSSGFYDWLGREESDRNRANRALLVEIKAVHKKSKRRYGSPRVYHQLRRDRVPCSENRVARLMRVHGIEAVAKRRFKATTDSDHVQPVADNVLDRQFEVECADAAWSADLTYVWTREGWLYLAIILDLFSRRILGWSAKSTMARSIVLEALGSALRLRQPSRRLLHHSDRGSMGQSPALRERRLPETASRGAGHLQHEPERQLLGQRSCRIVFCNPEKRTDSPTQLPNACRGKISDLRVHRIVVQSRTASLVTWLHEPRRV